MFEEIFRRRKLVPERLFEYGFTYNGEAYQYCTDIMKEEFRLRIVIGADENIDTILTEKENEEEYVLYKTNASGTYIGEVRAAIADVLQDISLKCCQSSVFKMPQTLRIIEFVFDTYGDELEFLWKKFPDNAVWRRKDTGKWYGAILTVSKSKLGLNSDEQAEIIDLRVAPEQMDELLKHKNYYPGWHMNKKNWYTIILNEGICDKELFERIRISYDLAFK